MQSTKWELYEYQSSRSVIDLGPNHLHSIFLNFFSSITADFNISSAIRWAIQNQWSSGFYLAPSNWWLIVYTLWNQLLLELSLDLFNTLKVCCRHIDDVHEEVWCRKNIFWQTYRVLALSFFQHFEDMLQTYWRCAWRSLMQKKIFFTNTCSMPGVSSKSYLLPSFIFFLSSFQMSKNFISLFSGTEKHTKLKLGPHMDSRLMCHVVLNQAAGFHLFLYFFNFLSLKFQNIKFFVTLFCEAYKS